MNTTCWWFHEVKLFHCHKSEISQTKNSWTPLNLDVQCCEQQPRQSGAVRTSGHSSFSYYCLGLHHSAAGDDGLEQTACCFLLNDLSWSSILGDERTPQNNRQHISHEETQHCDCLLCRQDGEEAWVSPDRAELNLDSMYRNTKREEEGAAGIQKNHLLVHHSALALTCDHLWSELKMQINITDTMFYTQRQK